MDTASVRAACATLGIDAVEITPGSGSSGDSYLINGAYLLRSFGPETESVLRKIRRVASVPYVPRLILPAAEPPGLNSSTWLVLELIPGRDLLDGWSELTPEQVDRIGEELARALDRLHSIRGEAYDIGHYVASVPGFPGTWREGHRRYWEILESGVEQLRLSRSAARLVERALRWLHDSHDALRHQVGPVLLHNDLHPKNIVVDAGELTGIIDWECSQFGEPDFELSHLVHWSAYPPERGPHLQRMIRAIVANRPICSQVPGLSARLTVYEIEHDLNQMIWHDGADAEYRLRRISAWIDGKVMEILNRLR